MMVMYRANGDVRDLSDEGARALIYAGICVAVEPSETAPKPPKPRPPAPKNPTPEKSTPVKPLTTEDFPVPTKTVT